MEAPTRPTTCDRCGKPFNTSLPESRYCSIACEEGRRALPINDPASDGYHLHLQGEPQSLIGKTLVASALKRTCYAPDWHRSPSDYRANRIVTHNESDNILVYETDTVIGTVVDLVDGQYIIQHEEAEDTFIRTVDTSIVLSQIRQDVWWVDG